MNVRFTKAAPDEADSLSGLAIASKGHWGYSREQLELWRKDLRVTAEYILLNRVRTMRIDSELVGFFAIKRGNEDILDHLWLHPKAIGSGLGGAAMRQIAGECRAMGIHQLIIISDPNAEGFYLNQGAIRIGEVESLPQGRMLPKLKFDVAQPSPRLRTE